MRRASYRRLEYVWPESRQFIYAPDCGAFYPKFLRIDPKIPIRVYIHPATN